MTKPSEQIGEIIDRFYQQYKWDENNTTILIKDYQIDEIRSFQVIYAVKEAVEIALAGVLFDYHETVVREYNSPGEEKKYEDDRDESDKNKDRVVM